MEAGVEATKATDGLEGSFCDELSIVPHKTANGKRDRILNFINNSVLSAAHEPITFPDISNLEKPNISNKSVISIGSCLFSNHEKENCIAIFWTGRPPALGSCHYRDFWAISL